MKLKELFLTPRSFTFEIENDMPYNSEENWQICLNGENLRADSRNVQSLFSLLPNTQYELIAKGTEETLTFNFKTPVENWTLNVKDFGAVGDGATDDTQAIQAALYACPPDGRVVVPAGRYNVTSLYFKSKTKLELQKGAVLVADPNRSGRAVLPGFLRDYKGGKFHLGSWEGNPLDCYAGIFTLIDVNDVTIYGEGILEGSGTKDGWWHNVKVKEGAWRPRAIYMRRCKNITIQGIRIQNSPSWTVHPVESEHLGFYNVSIANPWDSPNTDGINPESCRDVAIIGCHFSLGDDCIALKSGKIYMAETLGIPTRDVRIRNCYMENGHGAITLGSEMASGIRDVTVEQCIFKHTDRGLRIKTRRGRGKRAVIRDIVFRNIRMDEVMTPFVVNMFYFCDPDGHSPYVQTKDIVDGPVDALPTVGSLRFENIKAENCRLGGIFAYGLPEQPIEELMLKDVHMSFVLPSARAEDTPAMLDDNDWEQGDLIYVKNVERFRCENVRCVVTDDAKSVIEGVRDLSISEDSILPVGK